MNELTIGDQVIAHYKTGKYVGGITNIRTNGYMVVKILAVLKHPMQGDLHHPKQTEVDFFHERKALAYREQTNIPVNMVKPFKGEIPDYTESLRQSLETLKQELLKEESKWSDMSLSAISNIEREYFPI
ncbi:kinase-associated lipoprotein B [Bacillus sp. FJAT-27986]|uniref:kinase-associated lipoprotein B n=1 Tax=Bacillus sp. FJAT-27986 TaxID=1743146 RepID=UPI00080AD21F|nr:kinase-associated lipoprotein B [Bacillus sp. FJAT-27986]OCA84872.1 kinase [Bacillus sp. FJAT-27986]